jgi:outer membrane protein assembly factor BamB
MKGLLLAAIIPLTGCFSWSSRQPVWSSIPEPIDLADWSVRKPFAIPEKHLIVATTQSGHLVAYDASTGKLKWKSKAEIRQIRGVDISTITIADTHGITLLDASTGESVDTATAVAYTVQGSRELVAKKGVQLLWSDRLGFVPEEGNFPELHRGVLVFRGSMKHAAIDFIRVYAPDSGKLLWDLESEAETPNQGVFDAQLTGDRAVILREGIVTSRELGTGRIVWEDRSDRPPVVTAARVLTFDKNNVKVLDATNGSAVATWPPAIILDAKNATVADGVIYASHAVAVSTLGGTKYNCSLYALDETTGKVLWHSPSDKLTTYAAPIVIDDSIVIVSTDRIYAMKR